MSVISPKDNIGGARLVYVQPYFRCQQLTVQFTNHIAFNAKCRLVAVCLGAQIVTGGGGGLSFPKDETVRRQWIVAIKRNSDTKKHKFWSPHPRSVVCHQHFKEDDFETETRYGGLIRFILFYSDSIRKLLLIFID